MRRTLLALLLGLPAAALGQSAGSISTDATTINLAQCNGTRNTEVRLDDDLEMGLTWQVDLPTDVTFESGGTFQLWAANGPLAAGSSDTATSCTEQPSGTTTADFTVGSVGGEIDAPAQTLSIAEQFGMKEIATAAGYGTCDVETATHTIYLCVQWTAGSKTGWAKTTVTLDPRRPGAPTGVDTSPGDGKLHVSCSAGSSNQTFKARADGDGESPRYSSQNDSCSDLQITGLTNGKEYTVVVYGMNSANNPSVASSATTGTPVETDDFWDHYKGEGGPDSGGCGTAAGAAGLLGGLALLALRRRKP